MNEPENNIEEYLTCERRHVFFVLMGVAGFFGAFTYSIRGGIFCNAQTANFVLFAMALGNAQWKHALYFLIPMSAYFLGAVISEALPAALKSCVYSLGYAVYHDRNDRCRLSRASAGECTGSDLTGCDQFHLLDAV